MLTSACAILRQPVLDRDWRPLVKILCSMGDISQQKRGDPPEAQPLEASGGGNPRRERGCTQSFVALGGVGTGGRLAAPQRSSLPGCREDASIRAGVSQRPGDIVMRVAGCGTTL